MKSQDKPASRQHQPSTAAKKLGPGLQDADIIAAAWNVPLLSNTDSGMDDSSDAKKSVVDSININDDVYGVYRDVHEYGDTDTGSPGVENPTASWAAGIG